MFVKNEKNRIVKAHSLILDFFYRSASTLNNCSFYFLKGLDILIQIKAELVANGIR